MTIYASRAGAAAVSRRCRSPQVYDLLDPRPRKDKERSGGLQIKTDDGTWVDALPIKNTFVVNLGDALEHNTGGLYRATAHRVLQRKGATKGRYSFPFFYDPSFGAKMESVTHLLPPELGS